MDLYDFSFGASLNEDLIRTDGALEHINYSLSGNLSSPTCLVFIHGMACDQRNWALQVDYFAADYQILTFDLPGHGKSGLTSDQYWDVTSLALDIKQFLRTLKLATQLILIAHSASVRIALELNYLLANQTVGLVLLDCGYQPIPYPDALVWLAQIKQLGYQTWITQFFATKFGPSTPSACRAAILQGALALNAAMVEDLYVAIKMYDYYALEKCLRLTTVPMLILQSSFYVNGQYQHVLSAEEMRSDWLDLVKRTVITAQIQPLFNCGHWLMLQLPEQCNRLIAQWIRQSCAIENDL